MSWFSRLVSGSGATYAGPDQGIDFTGGGTVYALGHGIVTSINRNYQFRQGVGEQLVYQLTSGPAKGRYVYTNEALSVNPNLRVGSKVSPRVAIGSFLSSFPGIETGFAQNAQGQAYGNPDEGKGSNPADPQAYLFRDIVAGRNRNFASGSTTGNDTLSQLWVQAGGDPKIANIMAAIAMAESGGQVGIVSPKNSNGTVDRGLWQINSSHTQFNATQLTTDPLYNAKAAVSVYKAQGLTAWSTYNNGSYAQFLGHTGKKRYTFTRPGGDSSGGGGGGGGDSNGPDVTSVLSDWANSEDAVPPVPGNAAIQTTALFSGVPILDKIPLVDDIPNPLDVLTGTASAIHSVVDFLKVVVWIFHPVNILRMVEFLLGIGMMAFGLHAAMQHRGESKEGFQTSESSLSRSGLGRVSKELAAHTPQGKVVKAIKRHKPEAAPHTVRRTALKVRYSREQNVANRRTAQRRSGNP